MTTPSDLAKALAALRRRATFVCQVCGAEFEAWARSKQIPQTCTPACRQKLWRQARKARAT